MNETIADIIAEMRRFGNRHWMHDEGQNVRMFADRLEAAWKREKAEIEASTLAAGGMVEASRHKQVGNAAAMRESLVLVKIKLADWGFTTRHDAPPSGSLSYDCARLMEVVNAALSEPPRNCDKYRDYESLCRAWENAVRVEGITFGKWLFAPAAEREGDGDGK